MLVVGILLHIFFLWGIFKEIFGVVVAYAVINTINLIGMVPMVFIAPIFLIPSIIYELVPTIFAYYMIHLMKKSSTGPVVTYHV